MESCLFPHMVSVWMALVCCNNTEWLSGSRLVCLCVYGLYLYGCVAVWSPSIPVWLLVFLSETEIVRLAVVINQILALGLQSFPTNLSRLFFNKNSFSGSTL